MKTIVKIFSVFALISLISCTTSNEVIDPALLNPLAPATTSTTLPINPAPGTGGVSVALGVFKSDFDGQTFTANSTQAIVNNTMISISGLKADGSFFQISLMGAPSIGTYSNANTSQLALAYSAGNGQIPFLGAGAGSAFSAYPNYVDTAELKILSIDTANKIIKGTFKFTGGQINPTTNQLLTKTFINGEFNLNYTADTTTVPNNSFFAKIDGADFVPTNITGGKAGGQITIVGRRGALENISLIFDDTVTAGTVIDLTASSSSSGIYLLNTTPSGFFIGTGIITIISHNTATKKIKGTFTFAGATLLPPIANRAITLGTFDVTYL